MLSTLPEDGAYIRNAEKSDAWEQRHRIWKNSMSDRDISAELKLSLCLSFAQACADQSQAKRPWMDESLDKAIELREALPWQGKTDAQFINLLKHRSSEASGHSSMRYVQYAQKLENMLDLSRKVDEASLEYQETGNPAALGLALLERSRGTEGKTFRADFDRAVQIGKEIGDPLFMESTLYQFGIVGAGLPGAREHVERVNEVAREEAPSLYASLVDLPQRHPDAVTMMDGILDGAVRISHFAPASAADAQLSSLLLGRSDSTSGLRSMNDAMSAAHLQKKLHDNWESLDDPWKTADHASNLRNALFLASEKLRGIEFPVRTSDHTSNLCDEFLFASERFASGNRKELANESADQAIKLGQVLKHMGPRDPSYLIRAYTQKSRVSVGEVAREAARQAVAEGNQARRAAPPTTLSALRDAYRQLADVTSSSERVHWNAKGQAAKLDAQLQPKGHADQSSWRAR